MTFQPGNKLGGRRKDKLFRTALMLELKSAGEDLPDLRDVARFLIDTAKEEVTAARELIDRLDGKPAQVHIGDDDEDPIRSEQSIVERVIVHHEIDDTDESDFPATAGTA